MRSPHWPCGSEHGISEDASANRARLASCALGADELRAVVTGLAQRSQLSVQAHKHLVRRAARGEDAPAVFGTDEISEALFRQVLDGPDARIGQQAFLARTKPAFRWSGEDFWAGRGGPARTGRGHRVSLIRGRRQRRSSGLRP